MKSKKDKRSSVILVLIIVIGSLGAGIIALLLYVFLSGDFAANGEGFAGDIYEELYGTPEPAASPSPSPSPPNEQAAVSAPPTPAGPRPMQHLPEAGAYRVQFTGDDYVTIRMSDSDIYTGNLLLVNNDHSYEIPDDLDLVTVTSTRNSAYRVNSIYSRLCRSIMTPLNDMMQSFADEVKDTIFGRQNAYMYIISAYRNYDDQRRELNDQIYLQGYQAAIVRAKQPGHSEHHTGLAFDLATVVDGAQQPFDHYDVTKWFSRNSYRYGFILRYPSNKTSITKTIYEPWHYRYVGLPHSYIMHDRGWVLEEYIEKIREHTIYTPLETEYNGVSYEVFFSESADITVPANASVEISGNNVDGYIVTIYERYDRLTNVVSE